MTDVDVNRWNLVEKQMDLLFDRLTQKVIDWARSLEENYCTSGDPDLPNVWEEFKYQVQNQHSVYFDEYVNTLEGYCVSIVRELPREIQGILWLVTERFWDEEWWDEKEDIVKAIPFGDPVEEAVATELYNRVWRIAADEELDSEIEADEDEGEAEEPTDDDATAQN